MLLLSYSSRDIEQEMPVVLFADLSVFHFSPDVDFNVSGMFVAMTPEPDPGPFERRRPGSLVEGDTPRKDRYLSYPRSSPCPSPGLSIYPRTLTRQESRGAAAVSALYVVADESITVKETPAGEQEQPMPLPS